MRGYGAFVGLDLQKETIAVVDAGRDGEVRFWGEIANMPDAVARMVRKLGGRHARIHFVHEAGPCGYGIHRQIMAAQHSCEVGSPARTPRKPGDRIKTDRAARQGETFSTQSMPDLADAADLGGLVPVSLDYRHKRRVPVSTIAGSGRRARDGPGGMAGRRGSRAPFVSARPRSPSHAARGRRSPLQGVGRAPSGQTKHAPRSGSRLPAGPPALRAPPP